MSTQNKLTDKGIKKLKRKDTKYKVGDGDKLWLIVLPSGVKTWHYIWRRNGKLCEVSIGAYPAISLKTARQERDRLNSITALGMDPREERKNAAAEAQKKAEDKPLTFKQVALEWYDIKTATNSDKTRQGIMGRLNNHVLPFIGDKPIKEVAFSDLKAITSSGGYALLRHASSRFANFIKSLPLRPCVRIRRYQYRCKPRRRP